MPCGGCRRNVPASSAAPAFLSVALWCRNDWCVSRTRTDSSLSCRGRLSTSTMGIDASTRVESVILRRADIALSTLSRRNSSPFACTMFASAFPSGAWPASARAAAAAVPSLAVAPLSPLAVGLASPAACALSSRRFFADFRLDGAGHAATRLGSSSAMTLREGVVSWTHFKPSRAGAQYSTGGRDIRPAQRSCSWYAYVLVEEAVVVTRRRPLHLGPITLIEQRPFLLPRLHAHAWSLRLIVFRHFDSGAAVGTPRLAGWQKSQCGRQVGRRKLIETKILSFTNSIPALTSPTPTTHKSIPCLRVFCQPCRRLLLPLAIPSWKRCPGCRCDGGAWLALGVGSSQPWVLQIAYHSGFTGRAQPVLFLLEDAGLAYTRGGRDAVTDSSVFAWPRLQDGDIVLSQTVALVS